MGSTTAPVRHPCRAYANGWCTSLKVEFHHKLSDRPVTANKAIRVLSHMYRLGEGWSLVLEGINPCRSVEKYKALVGVQMRHSVHDRDGRPIAMLGFSTAARKLAARDRFIGWTPQLREKILPLFVDNPRFLILPWIAIPNLGSHILSLVR